MVIPLIKPVEAVTPMQIECKHDHWRVYQSRGYRECDKCKLQRPIFNVIKHQR